MPYGVDNTTIRKLEHNIAGLRSTRPFPRRVRSADRPLVSGCSLSNVNTAIWSNYFGRWRASRNLPEGVKGVTIIHREGTNPWTHLSCRADLCVAVFYSEKIPRRREQTRTGPPPFGPAYRQ